MGLMGAEVAGEGEQESPTWPPWFLLEISGLENLSIAKVSN